MSSADPVRSDKANDVDPSFIVVDTELCCTDVGG